MLKLNIAYTTVCPRSRAPFYIVLYIDFYECLLANIQNYHNFDLQTLEINIFGRYSLCPARTQWCNFSILPITIKVNLTCSFESAVNSIQIKPVYTRMNRYTKSIVSWYLYQMVAQNTVRTYGVNQVFPFVKGIWLHRKSRQF